MDRVFITHVDSLLGANVALTLADRFEVVGFCRQPVHLEGCQSVVCDLSHPAEVANRMVRKPPQWVVHCGPLAASGWDLTGNGHRLAALGAEEARFAAGLAQAAGKSTSRLTVLSTDAVFTGPMIFHEEDSRTAPAGTLAGAAVEMERAVAGTDAMIVRTHAYGWSPDVASPGLAERMWQALLDGCPCPADADSYATPILATDLAELLYRAYGRNLRGLYHIAGAERTSQYRFGMELAAAFGLADRHVAWEERPRQIAARAAETSLGTYRARRALQTPMPMAREGLARFAEQATDGFRAHLQGDGSATVRGHAA
ncbi:MAG: sugar nucleotide-binding protein [Pirellulales bacterium]